MIEIPEQLSRIVRAINQYHQDHKHVTEAWDTPESVTFDRVVSLVMLQGAREVRVFASESGAAGMQYRLPGHRWASCPLDGNQQRILDEFAGLF